FDGGMTAYERSTAHHIFAIDSTSSPLLMSLKAGGVGLNITCASKLIICKIQYNKQDEFQLMGQIHRHGQHQECHVYRLMAYNSPMDQLLAATQDRKLRVLDDIMD
ncbi:hypothetical protein BT63DRAFT_362016, partial [Microthyrium microscopicum]